MIDGYTQPGSSENTDPVATNAVLLIELDGSVAGGTGLHFTFASSPSTIQGLVVNRWDLAIMIQGAATIRGNFIGTDPTGSSARANERGIDMGPSNAVVVGGTTLADRNLISGNAGCFPNAGIRAQGTGTVVEGNLIGTDAAGTVAIPNCLGVVDGIGGVTIGGAAAGAGNVISGNTTALSLIQTVTTIVHGNRIGTTADGTGPLGNGRGITLGSNVIVGGTGPGEANVIAFSSEAGVLPNDGANNTIRGNSIHDNGGLGIDVGGVGPNVNDPLDADSGAQNAPILQSIEHLGPQGAGSTRVIGKLHSTPSTTFTLDFYSNPACTNFPRELPEGKTYLGEADVSTDVNGNAAIDVTFPVQTEDGARIAATATNPAGDTSEFSPRILFSVSPASGPDTGGTLLNVKGTDFSNPTTLTVGGVDANPVFVSGSQLNATAPAFAAGTAHDVVATTTDGTTATLIKGWVANFLDVPSLHQFHPFVAALVSNGITSGIGGGNYGVDQPTLRQQMAVFLLKAKFGLCYTPPVLHRRLPRRPLPLDLRRLDRGAGRRRHHGGLRRRKLLSGQPRSPGPDGRVSAEGQARLELRAAAMHGSLSRRGLSVPIRRLDRAARRRADHRRLRGRQLLPAEQPDTRGQMAVFISRRRSGCNRRRHEETRGDPSLRVCHATCAQRPSRSRTRTTPVPGRSARRSSTRRPTPGVGHDRLQHPGRRRSHDHASRAPADAISGALDDRRLHASRAASPNTNPTGARTPCSRSRSTAASACASLTSRSAPAT